jgi:hypothetical protein
MITEILEMVKAWHYFLQFLFVLVLVFSFGAIIIAVSGQVSDFLNRTLIILIRGYPPYDENNISKKEDFDSDN